MTGEGRCLEEKDEAGKAAFAARKEKANTDLQVIHFVSGDDGRW
jgi:hypothetical protein